MDAGEGQHVPVLVDQVLEQLNIHTDGIYIDGTFGRGGHSQLMLERLGDDGLLLAIDRDLNAAQIATDWAQQDTRISLGRCVETVRGNRAARPKTLALQEFGLG